jgi:hypothetical protein
MASAQEQRINLDPGLWQYSISLDVHPRGVVKRDTQSFCIDAATASMSADEIVRRMSQDQCRASNAVLGAGSGSAQMSCVYPEDNARGDGQFRATYNSTAYEIQAEMRFVGPGGTTNARFVGQGRRIGDCR